MLSRKIKEIRLEHNLTQKELSEKIDYSQSIITRWEKNECEPTATAIITLAKLFDVSADYILGLENEDGTKVKNTEEQQILLAHSKENKVKQFTLTQKELEEIIANAIKIYELK